MTRNPRTASLHAPCPQGKAARRRRRYATALLVVTAFQASYANETLYKSHCASCHGPTLQGGLGPSLLTRSLQHGASQDALTASIRTGNPEKGMPAWQNALSEADIQALAEYIFKRRDAVGDHPAAFPALPTQALESSLYRFKLQTVTDALQSPWSLAFLPNGSLLVTERKGGLVLLTQGQETPTHITGTPAIDGKLTDGYRSVAVHPGYTHNGWIYLSYVESRGRNAAKEPLGMLRIIRGRVQDGRWTDEESLWRAPTDMAGLGLVWGSNAGRMRFDSKGYLYFSIGEWGDKEREQEQKHPQDLSRPEGKIHRIHDDGRIPADNPYVNTPGAMPSVWSYGHRVPQGLAFNPASGVLWSSEHGPKGGDELNCIHRGANYGWPLITYGINYTGTAISEKTAAPGMQQPAYYWNPSIAISALAFYAGKAFPRWQGDLFITSLREQALYRAVLDGERVIHQELILKDLGRIRDIAAGPDGFIYLLLEEADRIKGRIVRLAPVE